MSDIAETLRAHAVELDKMQDTYEREALACEAGAASWALVQRLAEIDPWTPLGHEGRYEGCHFCEAARRVGREDIGRHDDCLWLQARSLVTAQERV